MSAERNGGRWSFQCDECSERLDTNERELEEAVQAMEAEGWHPHLQMGHRCHACPACRAEDR